MPYSFQIEKEDEKKIAKAFGNELNISPKHANEVCYAIKGMLVDKALEYLKRVQEKKEFIKFRRYKKKIPHRRKGIPGRYPVKAAGKISEILLNVKANAEYKGLNTERIKIIHATAYKALTLERIKPKGRARPSNIELTNIEIIVKEV